MGRKRKGGGRIARVPLWLRWKPPEQIMAELEARAIPVPFSGCLIWLGDIGNTSGYPRAIINNRGWLVCRYVCEQTHGPLKPGQMALHSCDIPYCIAAEHLRPGTAIDNAQDMVKRRRCRRKRGFQTW